MGIISRVASTQRIAMNPRSKIFAHQDPEGSKYEYRGKIVSESVIVSLREQINTRLSRGLVLMCFLQEKFRLLEAIELSNMSKPLVLRPLAIHFHVVCSLVQIAARGPSPIEITRNSKKHRHDKCTQTFVPIGILC